MYQVVEIKRKHVTRSCVACKLRHHKCSGVSPCHYCIAKNQPCVFDVQAKRGPKKTKTNKGTNKEPAPLSSPSSPPPSSSLSSSSSPSSYCGPVSSSVVLNTQGFNNEINIFNNKEVNLWCENQRVVSVNSFFELRGWWKNLLDHDALRDSSSISFQVQSLVIGAHICRFHGDKSSALKLFQASQKLLDTIENEESVEYVCSRLLMVDFLPSNTVPFGLSAWNKVKNLELKTNRQKRIYTYAKMYAIMFMQKIEPPDDSVVIMAESDVWDILHLLIFKIANSFVFKMFSYDVHYLNQIKEYQLTPDKCDKMLADINMMNWIIHGHSDVFGPEFQIIIPMMTALILWKKGSLNEAVAEGVRYLCVLRNFGDKQVFLSDILNMSIPLLIFKDAGMTHLLREALDLLAPVAFSTEQHELYYDLVNFYLNSTLPPRKPHLQIIDDNNNNNNNNKCNNSNNDNNIIVSYNLCSNNTNTNNYNNNSNNNNTHNSNIYSAANAIPISPICEDVINNNNNNNNIINYNIEINNNNNNNNNNENDNNSNNIPSSLPSPTLLSNLLPLPAELDFLFIHDHSVLPLL